MPKIDRCSDCDVALVHPDDIDDEPEPDELPPVGELVPIRISAVAWARGFSEALRGADIAHRIGPAPEAGGASGAERRSHDSGVAVYVQEEDRERALQMDAEYTRSQIPDLEDRELGERPASDAESCPACGEEIAADTPECASCGLPFIELD